MPTTMRLSHHDLRDLRKLQGEACSLIRNTRLRIPQRRGEEVVLTDQIKTREREGGREWKNEMSRFEISMLGLNKGRNKCRCCIFHIPRIIQQTMLSREIVTVKSLYLFIHLSIFYPWNMRLKKKKVDTL